MADVELKFVVETLVPLINENRQLIGGSKEDSAHLMDELNRLKALLHDAKKYRKRNSELWKHFVKEVQVIVYKAEGFIDKRLVKEEIMDKEYFKLLPLMYASYARSVRDLAVSIKAVLDTYCKRIREENPQAFDDLPEVVAPATQKRILALAGSLGSWTNHSWSI